MPIATINFNSKVICSKIYVPFPNKFLFCELDVAIFQPLRNLIFCIAAGMRQITFFTAINSFSCFLSGFESFEIFTTIWAFLNSRCSDLASSFFCGSNGLAVIRTIFPDKFPGWEYINGFTTYIAMYCDFVCRSVSPTRFIGTFWRTGFKTSTKASCIEFLVAYFAIAFKYSFERLKLRLRSIFTVNTTKTGSIPSRINRLVDLSTKLTNFINHSFIQINTRQLQPVSLPKQNRKPASKIDYIRLKQNTSNLFCLGGYILP